MSATFSIDIEAERDLVRIEMGGLFTADDIRAYRTARRAAHSRLLCAPNAHCTIVDLRDMKIQPQDSVATFQHMLADPEFRSRQIVFVIGRSLTRSQLLRALAGRGARCVDTPEEAEAWLFQGHSHEALRATG